MKLSKYTNVYQSYHYVLQVMSHQGHMNISDMKTMRQPSNPWFQTLVHVWRTIMTNCRKTRSFIYFYVRESYEESVPISCARARAKGVCKCGLTAEYPSTPKEILKSVATRLRRNAECRLSYRGHVEFEDGYAATQKT